jgi:hypothetical protein
MTVLTFVFLVCSLRVNLVFVLVLLGALIAFALLSAALFVESEALRMLGAGEALQVAGSLEAIVQFANGMNRLDLALKLVKVRSFGYLAAALLTNIGRWWCILWGYYVRLVFDLGYHACGCRFPSPTPSR